MHLLIKHIFSNIFQFDTLTTHPISNNITVPSPYRYRRPSELEVQVTRQAAPKLLTGPESFSTSQMAITNSDKCIISQNSISNSVFLHTCCVDMGCVNGMDTAALRVICMAHAWCLCMKMSWRCVGSGHVVPSHAYDTASLQASPHTSP